MRASVVSLTLAIALTCFVEGIDRGQSALFPECLEDWIGKDNPVRVIDVFVEELDLAELRFGEVAPEATVGAA